MTQQSLYPWHIFLDIPFEPHVGISFKSNIITCNNQFFFSLLLETCSFEGNVFVQIAVILFTNPPRFIPELLLYRPFLYDPTLLFTISNHRLHLGNIIFILLGLHSNHKFFILNPPQKQRQGMTFQYVFSIILFNSRNDVTKLFMLFDVLDADVRQSLSNLDLK